MKSIRTILRLRTHLMVLLYFNAGAVLSGGGGAVMKAAVGEGGGGETGVWRGRFCVIKGRRKLDS